MRVTPVNFHPRVKGGKWATTGIVIIKKKCPVCDAVTGAMYCSKECEIVAKTLNKVIDKQ